MITPVLIDDAARLRAMSAEWTTLLARSGANAITMHPDWMLPWWDVFGEGRALRTMAFREGDALVGLAPLLARRHVHRPRIPFRRLEILASGEDEADEIGSVHLALLAARGSEAAVADALATAVASGALGPWDELVLPAMDGEGAIVGLLRDALGARRLRVSVEPFEKAPFVPLPASFDAYLDRLGSDRRQRLLGWLRALDAWCGGRPVIERVRSAADLPEAWRVLEALHRERHPDGGMYRSSRFRAFHERAMPRLLALGALDVGWLAARGGPICAFYNLRWNGRVWHYLSAHARAVPDDAYVGVSLQALLLRDAIEAGMQEYDFLAGVYDYKTALSLEVRELVTLRAARRSLVESARRAVAIAAKRARRLRG